MDHLRDLALFVAVAETRSFTKASAMLGVPTSTVSRRIAELEASMDVKLLVRSTRQVELTEAGALYLSLGEGIVAAAREAHQQVRGLAEKPQGTLRLSVEAEVGSRLVAPVLAEYLERYPDIRIDLDLSPRRVDLLAEGFHLALRIGKLPDSGLIVRRLARLSAGLYAAPSYIARRGRPEHPADLLRHARIHLLHRGDRGEWRLMRGDEAIEVPSGGILSANNMTMIRHLACLGVGIAVVDDLMASEDVERGLLEKVILTGRSSRCRYRSSRPPACWLPKRGCSSSCWRSTPSAWLAWPHSQAGRSSARPSATGARSAQMRGAEVPCLVSQGEPRRTDGGRAARHAKAAGRRRPGVRQPWLSLR